ncbi:ABC transporter permease subunit [Streptomyces sp. NPDC020472]|uniref:ABC transporter permease subunit n=1 Tax=Streptomyces sp. NPDC020472 TaxID=3365075 RepID=UPI0037971BA1
MTDFLPELRRALPRLAEGLLVTAEATVLGAALALLLAYVLGLLSRSARLPVRGAARLVVEFFRGTSPYVQLFWLFFALPVVGFRLEPLACAVLGLHQNVVEAPVHVLGESREEADHRARDLLDLVGLGDKAGARPTRLSGGRQQRVAIARALAMRPEIPLLDEVTSALDPELVAEVLDALRDIARGTDVTLLCVTHETGFARDVSDRILMFDRGRIVGSGPAGELLESPAHARTRAFLGSVR